MLDLSPSFWFHGFMKTQIVDKQDESEMPNVGEPFRIKGHDFVFLRLKDSVAELLKKKLPYKSIYAVDLKTGSLESMSGGELKNIEVLQPSDGVLKFTKR